MIKRAVGRTAQFFLFLYLLLLGACGAAPPTVAPEEVGLQWQECPIPYAEFRWQEVEECFGHSMPLWNEGESARYARRVGLDDWLLVIGQDIYRTRLRPILPCYTLHKNGSPVKTLCGDFGGHSPNLSLQNVGGQAVWEFADSRQAAVIYDGRDVRRLYHLDRAYRPYGLADKLILIGRRNDRYFVVYDGRQIGPDFDDVVIAYCCEAMLYSVQAGQDRYLFSGVRDGRHYLVEVTAGRK